jgi:hypothetical protein
MSAPRCPSVKLTLYGEQPNLVYSLDSFLF